LFGETPERRVRGDRVFTPDVDRGGKATCPTVRLGAPDHRKIGLAIRMASEEEADDASKTAGNVLGLQADPSLDPSCARNEVEPRPETFVARNMNGRQPAPTRFIDAALEWSERMRRNPPGASSAEFVDKVSPDSVRCCIDRRCDLDVETGHGDYEKMP
jgi:hypothetical protein